MTCQTKTFVFENILLWKQGQLSWEKYTDATRLCRDGVRKAKEQIDLTLARDAKNNKKGFYRYVSQKRKVKENPPHLMSKTGKLVTKDEEKAEALNNISTSVPQSSLAISLPTPLKWMDHKTGTEGAKSLPL